MMKDIIGIGHIQRRNPFIGEYRRELEITDKKGHRLTRVISKFTSGIGDTVLRLSSIANIDNWAIDKDACGGRV
jgi:hypothetical protein